MKSNFCNISFIAVGSNSLKKTKKQSSLAIFGKKNEGNNKKRPK